MDDLLLKIITSGGGASSALIIYLMFSIRKELTKMSDHVSAMAIKQEVLEEKVITLRKRLQAQESSCLSHHGGLGGRKI